MPLTRVNGEHCEHLSVSNRGLAYGDGVFTTVKVIDQRPQLWEAHRRRLNHDCRRLALPFDLSALEAEVAEICSQASDSAVLKVMLVRGEGERGYRPPASEAIRILQAMPGTPYPNTYYEQGVAVTVCRLRLAVIPTLAGVKHLNRLEQVLARAEWGDEYAEGLMLDAEQHVIEGTMSNLFIMSGNQLLTPSLENCGIAGVMREHLINNAPAVGFEVREAHLALDDLYACEGVFLCNALIGAWPVASIAGRACGAPGFISEHFRNILNITAMRP